MLGRLLSTATSTFAPTSHSSRAPGHLESVTEEEHTSGLLFPDVSVLQGSKTHAYPLQTSGSAANAFAAGSFDDRGGLDVDAVKDFRVLIAQNAIGDRDDPCVLLDSQNMSQIGPSGRPPQERQGPERQPRGKHSRHSTLSKAPSRTSRHGSQSSVPNFDRSVAHSDTKKQDPLSSSAFFHARNRRSTCSVMSGDNEAQSSRLASDANELSLLNCVFGSSAFNYRGSSTKMHILPGGGEPPREVDSHGLHGIRRRSPLYRSTDDISQAQAPNSFHARPPHLSEPKLQTPTKVAVLVTRMFSVNLPEACEVSAQQPEQSASPEVDDSDFPFFESRRRKKIKEKKTPMYAVAMIIHLPLATKGSGLLPSQCASGADPAKQPTYLSVSLDSSQRRSGSFFDEHFGSNSTASNLDDRIDTLVDHWDIINRTLSHVEKLATKEILTLLKQVDALSVRYPKPAKPQNMQRTNQRIVQLPPGSLVGNPVLRAELLRSTHRVCMALSIPRVITGQSRWGIWREEARWIARYLNDKEHNFFFLVLITAFLGNHTEWLSSLGPDWYRRRHHLQQKAQLDNELIMSNRTVIISPDKMTARRLIFVLSAFLPSQPRSDGFASPFRPSSAVSGHPYCMSPPNAPVSRQQSLRRTINRRARTRQPNDEPDELKRSASVVSNEGPAVTFDDTDFSKSYTPHGRRDSDARSVMTTNLPIPSNDTRTRKSVTPTAATAAPGTATPVPHFASQHGRSLRRDTDDHSLNGNASAASVNLLQQLQRSESFDANSNGEPHSPRKWGSFLSGFWGSRESPSFGHRDPEPTHGGQARRSSVVPLPVNRRLSIVNADKATKKGTSDVAPPNDEVSTLPKSGSRPTASQNLDTAKVQDDTESRSLESPVKLSVEVNDGVVDVELPLPGFLSLSSSGDSTLTSPKKTRTSVTSVDSGASIHSANPSFSVPQKEYDGLNVNVSGWLKRYHDDFLLQAVCPYSNIETDIKRSMSAEPTPSHLCGSAYERWVDVCTTLVADTTTFTVKRFRLRRKLPAGDSKCVVPSQDDSAPTSPYNSLLTSQISNTDSQPTTPESPEEEFIEEPVMDLDGTLVDAVERVIARSGPPSAIHSRAASPNRLRKGRSGLSETTDSNKPDVPPVEVPRKECRRTVLGALEEVVRSVASERRQNDANSSRRNPMVSTPFTDNTLREGVRKWLLDIEEAC